MWYWNGHKTALRNFVNFMMWRHVFHWPIGAPANNARFFSLYVSDGSPAGQRRRIWLMSRHRCQEGSHVEIVIELRIIRAGKKSRRMLEISESLVMLYFCLSLQHTLKKFWYNAKSKLIKRKFSVYHKSFDMNQFSM